MMQWAPSIGVKDVDIGIAIVYDGTKGILLLLLWREDGLMDWRLAKDAHLMVDLVATVDKVFDILGVGLGGSLVEVLKDAPGVLVLADLKWLG